MCCVCISRRGMVYFGASIHIFVTLILFIGSTYRAYRISSYEREENSKHLLGATVISMYFCILLVLGCLIFRGVEHKSPKMLGWSGGAFITLETFAFVFNLVLLSPMGGAYDQYGLRNFGFSIDIFQIFLSLIFLCCMAGYCVVIILYILKLREDDTGSEYMYGEFDDGGTIPAPPQAINLSRSSTVHSNYSGHPNSKAGNAQLTGSHGQINQCNNQYHAGNHTVGGGIHHHKSPILQDRRLHASKANHLSQDRLNEAQSSGPTPPQYILTQQQRLNPYAHTGVAGAAGADLYANYTHRHLQHCRAAGMPQRQTQTLPHPHHYHRHMPSAEGGGLATTSTQFPSNQRMDLASLTQTISRNSNLKRVVASGGTIPIRNTVGDSRITASGLHSKATAATMDSNFEGDNWEQPRVQALKYNYGSARKGITGSTVGIEV